MIKFLKGSNNETSSGFLFKDRFCQIMATAYLRRTPLTANHPDSRIKPSIDPGIEAENFVSNVLFEWKLKKRPFLDGRRITRIIHSDKNDKCDREGVDVWVSVSSYGELWFPIQVKSSDAHHLKDRHHKRHKYVKRLIVAKLTSGTMEPEARLLFEQELESLINEAIRAAYPRRYVETLRSVPKKQRTRRSKRRGRH